MADDLENDNVLNNILDGDKNCTIPSINELDTLLYRSDKDIKKDQDTESQGKVKKKKVTYYLSEQVFVELTKAKAKIRVMVPKDMQTHVSLSRIVDYAVRAILDELKVKGEKSTIVQDILKKDT